MNTRGLRPAGLLIAVVATLALAAPPTPWTLILDRKSIGKYEDLSFPDTAHGWVVHALGQILATKDGGRTWTEQATKLGSLRSVEGLDARRAFAGTLDSILYRTTDGGATWTNVTASLPKKPIGFCGIAHRGERVYMVGVYDGSASDYYASRDGGNTWTYRSFADVANGLVDVEFVSDSVGFVSGVGPRSPSGVRGGAIVFKTTDAGATWRRVYQLDVPRSYGWKLFALSPRVLYLSIQSEDGIFRIAKSDDGGEHWRTIVVASGQRGEVQAVGFIDEANGWVGGFFRGMYATSDSGATWTLVDMTHGTINRIVRVGNSLVTTAYTGVLRWTPDSTRR